MPEMLAGLLTPGIPTLPQATSFLDQWFVRSLKSERGYRFY